LLLLLFLQLQLQLQLLLLQSRLKSCHSERSEEPLYFAFAFVLAVAFASFAVVFSPLSQNNRHLDRSDGQSHRSSRSGENPRISATDSVNAV
jgi:hypothetical protein